MGAECAQKQFTITLLVGLIYTWIVPYSTRVLNAPASHSVPYIDTMLYTTL